jgi:hypothetical protein
MQPPSFPPLLDVLLLPPEEPPPELAPASALPLDPELVEPFPPVEPLEDELPPPPVPLDELPPDAPLPPSFPPLLVELSLPTQAAPRPTATAATASRTMGGQRRIRLASRPRFIAAVLSRALTETPSGPTHPRANERTVSGNPRCPGLTPSRRDRRGGADVKDDRDSERMTRSKEAHQELRLREAAVGPVSGATPDTRDGEDVRLVRAQVSDVIGFPSDVIAGVRAVENAIADLRLVRDTLVECFPPVPLEGLEVVRDG